MARIRVLDRRVALIEAGLRVMDRGGVAAATTRAVVAEADMSLASFHYAFSSRDELIAETMRRLIVECRSQQPDDRDLPADLAESLTIALCRRIDVLLDDPGRTAVLVELTETALRTPALAEIATELIAARRGVVARLLEQWADQHAVRWRFGLPDVASTVLATLDGLMLQWFIDADTAAARRGTSVLAAALSGVVDPYA